MPAIVACIVEGHGDVSAVPLLIRRIAAAGFPELDLLVLRPIRVSRQKLVKAGELERAVELAARQTGVRGGSSFSSTLTTIARRSLALGC